MHKASAAEAGTAFRLQLAAVAQLPREGGGLAGGSVVLGARLPCMWCMADRARRPW